MKRKGYTKEQLIDAVKTSFSYSEVCRKLGLVDRGGNLNTIKKKIFLYKLDASHFTGQLWNKGVTFVEQPKIYHKDINDLLAENSNHSSTNLRKRLLLEGVKEYKCECCGNSEWNGKPIPLELHHINGNHYDNRVENLMVLCPNCHAQTDNYGNKNKNGDIKTIYISTNTYNDAERTETEKHGSNLVCPVCGNTFKKKNIKQIYCSIDCYRRACWKNADGISHDSLINAFNELKSFTKVGERFGMTDNAIRKWCKKFGIPTNRTEIDKYVSHYPGMQKR